MRRPILVLAIAGITAILWLLGRILEITGSQHPAPMPAAQSARPMTESMPELHDDSQTATAPIHRDSQTSTALTPMDADIPRYESLPADLIVEIGPPIDADNPPLDTPSILPQVINMGPMLDADGPITMPENSSTEIVSIGDPMPVDEEPR